MDKFIIFLTMIVISIFPIQIQGQTKTGRENLYIYAEDDIHSTSQCFICFFKDNKMYWVSNGIDTIEWGYAAIDRFISILQNKGEINVYRLDTKLSNSEEVAYSGWNGVYTMTFIFSKDFEKMKWPPTTRKFTRIMLEDNRNNNDIIYE